MTKQTVIRKLASASKQVEGVHLAVRKWQAFSREEQAQLDNVTTRLTRARMEVSVAISRLEQLTRSFE